MPRRSLLPDPPDPRRSPKAAVVYAADELRKAAVAAGPTQQGVAYRYDQIIVAIETQINLVNGGLKGPAQNARAIIDDYLPIALQEDYRLDDADVVRRFAYFLLAVATEGFDNEDTTGTQMGNFKGSWRGGGFD